MTSKPKPAIEASSNSPSAPSGQHDAAAEGFVRLYKLVDNGRSLQLVHKTALGGIPGALAGFKGRLLVGVGPIVRLYDLGKKKLLRKSEYRRCVQQPQ